MTRTYTVRELYRSFQGEGGNTGRICVLCRFAGCNLWTGRERDRATAICRFCDTDFVGGEKYRTAGALATAIQETWASAHRPAFVVFTGGEPTLQLTAELVEACHWAGFEVAVESNGTRRPPTGVDWLTVSPKAGAPVIVERCSELKIAFPQSVDPGAYDHIAATRRYLQPIDGPALTANTAAALEYCTTDPRWRLSLQTHKLVGAR